jgi:hypothetical protein
MTPFPLLLLISCDLSEVYYVTYRMYRFVLLQLSTESNCVLSTNYFWKVCNISSSEEFPWFSRSPELVIGTGIYPELAESIPRIIKCLIIFHLVSNIPSRLVFPKLPFQSYPLPSIYQYLVKFINYEAPHWTIIFTIFVLLPPSCA